MQNGVIAAMGLHCFEKYTGDSMVSDHANLKRLAKALAKIPAVENLDLEACQSNMVYFDLAEPHTGEVLKEKLREKGIVISAHGNKNIRLCTHHQVLASDIDIIVEATKEILA